VTGPQQTLEDHCFIQLNKLLGSHRDNIATSPNRLDNDIMCGNYEGIGNR
jgi:hypothetical protein